MKFDKLYLVKKCILVLSTVIVVIFIAPVILNGSRSFFNAYADKCANGDPQKEIECKELKNYIYSKVGDEKINVVNSGEQSFGAFLWGLAGCESTWRDWVINPNGWYGLHQYDPGTWDSANRARGVSPIPDKLDPSAQIDTTIWIIRNNWGGGFNHWIRCTNTDPDDGEWKDHISEWSTALPPTPTPPQPGEIRVKKDGISPGVNSQTIWLDSGAPSTTSNSYTFGNQSAGIHTVHITLKPGDDLLRYAKYTYCNSTPQQLNCGTAAGEQEFHWLNNLEEAPVVTANEAVVQVDVPPGGFVDIRWLYPPFALPGTGGPPPLPPTPTTYSVANLPASGCSNSIYGGNQFTYDGSNIITSFTVTGATKAEYEIYQDGARFYNSIADSNSWLGLNPAIAFAFDIHLWNLSPDTSYTWRVRAGNEGGWSNWVPGSPWMVPVCGPPSLPVTLPVENLPACSDSLYGGGHSWTLSGLVTEAEYVFRRDGSVIRRSSGGGLTGFSYSDLSPGYTYSWAVRARNSAGWSDWAEGQSYRVLWCSKPDLIGQHEPTAPGLVSLFDKHWVTPGATVTFNSGVLNNGDGGILNSFSVKWYVGNTAIKSATHQGGIWPHIGEGLGHDKASYKFNNLGTYTVKFCADDPNAISESNESNNCTFATIYVVSVVPPNLYITNCEDKGTASVCVFNKSRSNKRETYFTQGEPMTVEFTINKERDYSVSDVWVDVWAPYSGQSFSPPYCNQQGMVASVHLDNITQENTSQSITFQAPFTLGTYRILVLIDSRGRDAASCAVIETNETDNLAIHTFTVTPSPLNPNEDSDSDGFSNQLELYIGTDPLRACPDTTAVNDEVVDAWPPDFDDNRKVDLLDQLIFKPAFGSDVNDANYNKRVDLDNTGSAEGGAKDITLTDLLLFKPYFGKSCSP